MVDTAYPVRPSQTTPATEAPDNNEDTTQCPLPLPQDLDVIKEFIHHDKDDDYTPLMPAIAQEKMKALTTGRIQQRQDRRVSRLWCVH